MSHTHRVRDSVYSTEEQGRGRGEGLDFDAAGNVYVTRWCIDDMCGTANTVEMFNAFGQSLGPVGSGYDCAPHAIVFDLTGAAYVGQAGCTGAVLKFPSWSSSPTAFAVQPELQGSFWIDLAPDQCTLFYTSVGPNVKRFDVCTGVQLPNFNVAPLPGGLTHDLRVLPDGGVLVASGEVIARLNASGALVQTYAVAGEPSHWTGVKAEIVQHVRPQQAGQLSDVLQRKVGQRAQLLDAPADGIHRRLRDQIQLNLQRRERLPDAVVQLVRDAAPLRLLRAEHAHGDAPEPVFVFGQPLKQAGVFGGDSRHHFSDVGQPVIHSIRDS
jgi:hypothetical protein